VGDMSAVGCTGVVIVATRGTSGPGEVSISIRGSTEAFLAWSDEPIAKGTRVMVVDVRGPRTVEIRPTEGLNLYPST
jgi:membrane protein implicated in regulation of membrane protease activity